MNGILENISLQSLSWLNVMLTCFKLISNGLNEFYIEDRQSKCLLDVTALLTSGVAWRPDSTGRHVHRQLAEPAEWGAIAAVQPAKQIITLTCNAWRCFSSACWHDRPWRRQRRHSLAKHAHAIRNLRTVQKRFSREVAQVDILSNEIISIDVTVWYCHWCLFSWPTNLK